MRVRFPLLAPGDEVVLSPVGTMEPLPRFCGYVHKNGKNPSGSIEKPLGKKVMAVPIFRGECARSRYLLSGSLLRLSTKWVMKILALARWTRRETFSPSDDTMSPGQYRRCSGAFVEGL